MKPDSGWTNFLNKYMKEAGVSVFLQDDAPKKYCSEREKCTGKEILLIGDEVKLFLAEENAGKVRGTSCRLQRAKKKRQGRKQKNIFWHLRN